MPHNRKPLPELIAYHEAKAEYARARSAMWTDRAEKSERRAAKLTDKRLAAEVAA